MQIMEQQQQLQDNREIINEDSKFRKAHFMSSKAYPKENS